MEEAGENRPYELEPFLCWKQVCEGYSLASAASASLVQGTKRALRANLSYADEHGIHPEHSRWQIQTKKLVLTMLLYTNT